MTTDDEYSAVHRFTDDGLGTIVWRTGTGGNVEILDIRAKTYGEGKGRELLSQLLHSLKSCPPYATVFGFSRVGNADAHMFYCTMGFDLSRVDGVYADGEAIVFSQLYTVLCDMHLHGG